MTDLYVFQPDYVHALDLSGIAGSCHHGSSGRRRHYQRPLFCDAQKNPCYRDCETREEGGKGQ